MTTRAGGHPVRRDPQAEQEVEAVLRGERVTPAVPRAFTDMVLQHGVAGLLIQQGAADRLPREVAATLTREAHRQVARWALRHRELARLFEAASAASIDLLLIKGGHLAYAVYADPAVRDCEDVDLFVRPAHRARFEALASSIGLHRSAVTPGDAALGQAIFERPGVPGTTLDLHTRLFTAVDAASRLPFEALWARSTVLPAFPRGVRVPCLEDALDIALLHQAVHHRGHTMLLWTYDVYLLLARLGTGGAEAFVERALAAGPMPAHTYPIADAQQRFPTPAGASILEGLRRRGDSAAVPPAPSRLRQLSADLKALRGTNARVRLLSGHLFPPRDYMRHAYAPASAMPLPVLYLLRVLRGARTWF